MKLDSFIAQTLSEIIRGVHKAKVDSYQLSSIAPGSVEGVKQDIETRVSFDVAVTVSETSDKSGAVDASAGGEVRVLGVGVKLGAGGENKIEKSKMDSRVSRVSFEVPILLNKHHRKDASMEAEVEFVRKLIETKQEG